MCSAMTSVGKLFDCQQIFLFHLLELLQMSYKRLIFVYKILWRKWYFRSFIRNDLFTFQFLEPKTYPHIKIQRF